MNFKHVLIIFLAFLLMSFGLPKNIQKRVNKEIAKTYDIEIFDFSEVILKSEFTKDLPSKFQKDNFFKIESKKELIGYAYISKAPSKTAQFDYLVLLDKDLVVKKSKILMYREEYGGEIGSTRWLKQFIDKKGGDELKYGDNIDAIAGATISVRSMTNAMNDLLKSLKILKSKNAL